MDIRIDGGRLRQSLERMARVGATPGGGVNRLALTDADREARDLLVKWLDETGLQVDVDAMGNIFGRRPGSGPEDVPVLAGSHLDSQPRGGRFDGTYGVLAALEVARTLQDKGLTIRRPFEVVNWTNEEGSRFSPPMIGSAVFAGLTSLEEAHAIADDAGTSIGEELARIGYRGAVPCGGRPVHAYLETHIEQGPVLEAEGATIGVVQGIQAMSRFLAIVRGEADHAGTTPMATRRDALVATADMVRGIRDSAVASRERLVATVGSLSVVPDSPNVIPGEVTFTIDLRSPEPAVLTEAERELPQILEAAAEREGSTFALERTWQLPLISFASECVEAVGEGAQALGYSQRGIVSGAGHDAGHLARVCDSGMIFVPCENGRSHTEAENASWRDLEAGANVLLRAVLRLCE
jgi:N-carbamoyl-L-amino-acid hydrolase